MSYIFIKSYDRIESQMINVAILQHYPEIYWPNHMVNKFYYFNFQIYGFHSDVWGCLKWLLH
jgi:hypothetical protein